VGVINTRRSLGRFVTDAVLLARLPLFPVTAFPLLTGALLADPLTPISILLKLAAVGLLAHVYGFILNDIVDVNIDRENPQRRYSPLVQRRVSAQLALVVTIATIPLAHAMLASVRTCSVLDHFLLGTSFFLAAVYNLSGKRFQLLPLIPDLCLGVAVGLLALLGSHLVAGHVPTAAVLISTFYVLQLLLVNSIHGGIKDIDTDLRSGVVTTPIWWGAGVREGGVVNSPLTFKLCGLSLQALSIASIVAIVLLNRLGDAPLLRFACLAAVVFLSILMLIDTCRVLWMEDLALLRTCKYPHTWLGVLMAALVLLYCAPNERSVTVLAGGLIWDRLLGMVWNRRQAG
jgi:4-hydroxybenzoate polyprenyltransferase